MNVLLIDSTPLFLAGFSHTLKTYAHEIKPCCASSLSEIWCRIDAAQPDLILLDEEFEDEECYALLKRLRDRLPEAQVLVTVRQYSISLAISALSNGAAGIIPKKSHIETIVSAIRQVSSGSVYIPILPSSEDEESESVPLSFSPLGNNNFSRLTRRQSQILELLTTGASNKQICRQLGLAEGTVKNHLYTIFRLLKVRNRTEAAIQLSQFAVAASPTRTSLPLDALKPNLFVPRTGKAFYRTT